MTTGVRRYHIAHILPFASLGGTEIATLRTMQWLEEGRFQHTAFCLDGADEVRQMFTAEGFGTASYGAVEASFHRPHPYLLHSLRLAREFTRRGVDLLHCQDVLAAYRCALAGKLAGVPVLCHVRAQRDDIGWREHTLLAAVDRFAFVSQDTWGSFGHKVKGKRGAVVYDGLDMVKVDNDECERSVRAEFGLPADTRVVGMVARVAPEKDFVTFAKAAAHVVAIRPDVRFLMVGDHSSLDNYRQHYAEVARLLDAIGLTDYFIFTGHREDVTRLRAAMELCVLCSHTEGLGLAVLEGLAQGKPVLATAVGGVPEMITDGQTGLLHEPEAAAQLATQILALLADPARAARLGAAGLRLVQTCFNRERFIQRTTGLYDALLAGRAFNDGSRDSARERVASDPQAREGY